jgi:hypothetical protein
MYHQTICKVGRQEQCPMKVEKARVAVELPVLKGTLHTLWEPPVAPNKASSKKNEFDGERESQKEKHDQEEVTYPGNESVDYISSENEFDSEGESQNKKQQHQEEDEKTQETSPKSDEDSNLDEIALSALVTSATGSPEKQASQAEETTQSKLGTKPPVQGRIPRKPALQTEETTTQSKPGNKESPSPARKVTQVTQDTPKKPASSAKAAKKQTTPTRTSKRKQTASGAKPTLAKSTLTPSPKRTRK